MSCALCWLLPGGTEQVKWAEQPRGLPGASRGLAEQGLLPRLHTEPKPCPAALRAPTAWTAQAPGSEDGFASSCPRELTALGISFAQQLPSEGQTLPRLPQSSPALGCSECVCMSRAPPGPIPSPIMQRRG